MNWDARYEGLTKFELLTLFDSSQSLLITYISLFMSMLFAYLAMSHFAAKQLSKAEAIVITALYSSTAFLFIGGALGNAQNMSVIVGILEEDYSVPSWAGLDVAGLLLIAWLLSILFLIHARRAR